MEKSFEVADVEKRMAARWMRTGPITASLRDQDCAVYIESFPGLRSLTWISESGQTTWTYPRAGNAYLLDYDFGTDPLRWKLIQQVKETGRPAFSGLLGARRTGRRGSPRRSAAEWSAAAP